MKNLPFVQPLVQRWRAESEAPATRRPFRLWMTGSLAVVMAAVIPLRGAAEAERGQAMRLLRHSRFTVGETLQRIEIAARDRGFAVLARVPGSLPMLVLASSIGGTPVVMNDAHSRPAMPLSLMVSAAADGGADVLIASAQFGDGLDEWLNELPAGVVDELQALPGMVERALS